LVDTVCLAVQLAYRLQFISLQAIILVPLLSISLLRLAPSTVYYIYDTHPLLVQAPNNWLVLTIEVEQLGSEQPDLLSGARDDATSQKQEQHIDKP